MTFHILKLKNKKSPEEKIRDYFNTEHWYKILKRNSIGKYKYTKRK